MSTSSDLTIELNDSGVASHNTSGVPPQQNCNNSPMLGMMQSFGEDFDAQFKYSNAG